MARVQIELPERFLFRTEIPVRIDDINYGGHLGNDAVLTLAHEARLRFLASRGWSELDAGGAGLIMADAAVIYRAEGRHGMVLVAEVAVTEVRSRSCDFVYRLTEAATGREIARAKTGMVFYDYASKKVVTVPESFSAAISAAA